MGLVEMTFGASEFFWGAENPRNLGTTRDGGRFLYEMITVNQVAHHTGTTPYRTFVVGRNVVVQVELLEYTIDNLLMIISDGVLRTDSENPNNQAIDIAWSTGSELGGNRLVLHPVGASSSTNDIVLWKAVVLPGLEFVTHVDRERTFQVRFQALIDEDDAGNKRLARLGDRLIVPTAW
jgi:hypothetical protein